MIDGHAYYLRQIEEHEIGMGPGEECGRFDQPDEDAPRGYRPRPCPGVMVWDDIEGCYCDICGGRP